LDTETSLSYRVLKQADTTTDRNQAISQIASSFYWVDGQAPVIALAGDLEKSPQIQAVGVVDDSGQAAGLIVRTEFFGLLGRPYGRDVLRNSTAGEVMTSRPTFRHDVNIFLVAEELAETLRQSDIVYFSLVDENGGFCGLFSSHDLLLYLSQMTTNDIALARKLQSRIVRERDLVVGKTFEFASHSSSAKGVGGDFYSIFRTTDEDWLIAMCDVSGKGVAASIVTSVIWGMMSIYDFGNGLRQFIQRLNNHVMKTFDAEKFITGMFLEYNETSREMRVIDMGHSHLFLVRDGKMLRVATNQSNLPIGVTPDADLKVSRFVPESNDILVLLTDGLVEQQNRDGDTYSIDRAAEVIVSHASRGVEEINDRLIDDFERFRGSHHLTDDVTYSIMKFVPQEITL